MQRRAYLACGASFLMTSRLRAALPGTARVTLRTIDGTIEIEVFLDRAPLSAGAFLGVIDAGGYDEGAFTRVVRPDNDHGTPPISVVQARAAVSSVRLAHENTRQTGLHHLDGTVSLPRDKVGTATGAAFFVCVGDQPALDFGGRRNPDRQGFAAFGRVVGGMDVVRRIWSLQATGASSGSYTAGQMLRPPVRILGAKRIA